METENEISSLPFPIVSGGDYLNLPSGPSTWLLKGLVPTGGSCVLYGDPKCGKSFGAMQMGLAIANGTSWLGFPTERAGKVVYLQLDTCRAIWQLDLRKLIASNIDISPIFQADRETLPYPFDILDKEHAFFLRQSLMEIKPDCVVIDTVRMTHSVNENDSTTMKQVYSALVGACKPAAMIILAHSKKPQGEDGGGHNDVINDNRGSNFLVGAVDCIVKMTRKTLLVKGRAIEDTSLKVKRLPNLFWETDGGDVQLESILADPAYTTQSDQARELSVREGISFEAARKRLQRYLDAD